MKKAQTATEYLLALVLTIVICYGIGFVWNTMHTILHSTGGVRDQNGIVNVPPMTNDEN